MKLTQCVKVRKLNWLHEHFPGYVRDFPADWRLPFSHCHWLKQLSGHMADFCLVIFFHRLRINPQGGIVHYKLWLTLNYPLRETLLAEKCCIAKKIFLKGQCHEIFTPGFFLQTVPLGPSRHAQKRFRFFSIIRWDIRLFLCFAGVNDTGNACIAGVIDTGE